MKKVSMLALAFVIASKGAMAGGFSLSEYSTTSLGRGFAGMGVVGDDYSAIISNPAGMTLVRDGMQIGASFIDIYHFFFCLTSLVGRNFKMEKWNNRRSNQTPCYLM
jgi:long-subunit fatty acid transport protein